MDTPSWSEVIGNAIDQRIGEITTVRPGRIDAVRGNTVDVQPLVWAGGEQPPIIPSVPIAWVRAGTAYLAMTVQAGDTGMLLACDADIAEWRRTGEAGLALDQARHHPQNSVFLPGLVVAAQDVAMPVAAAVLTGRPNVLLGDAAATQKAIMGDALHAALFTPVTGWAWVVQAAILSAGGPDITVQTNTFSAKVTAALSSKVKIGS